MSPPVVFWNPRRRSGAPALGAPSREPLAFHRSFAEYAPTPLHEAPELARLLGVGRVLVKDESSRLGLPSFKMLGASWAGYRALAERIGPPLALGSWGELRELAGRVAAFGPLTLVAATDGNHGRAVARFASLLGLGARIYVPAGTAKARIEAIESEGAALRVVDGTYDDAVLRSAADASPTELVISDTSWPGYTKVPSDVIEGYSTIFLEIEDALAAATNGASIDGAGGGDGEAGSGRIGADGAAARSGADGAAARIDADGAAARIDADGAAARIDAVVVPIGVGALASAAVRAYRSLPAAKRPAIVGVEPRTAACVLESVRAGAPVVVPGPHRSIMAGLNCGRPSEIALPILAEGIDVFVAIDDEPAREAMRRLAGCGIVAGETGAAALGGVDELVASGLDGVSRRAIGLEADSTVVLVSSEGATDPDSYRAIVGREPAVVAGERADS